MGTSRLPGFYKMRIAERLRRVAEQLEVDGDELDGLGESGTLPLANADAMIENAVGVLGLPVGVGLNFVVNGEDLLIPMAVEEPSVIAAVGLAAKIARDGGGFQAEADPPRMIGQVQVSSLADPPAAKAALLREKRQILEAANALQPAMKARGGGAQDLEVRLVPVRDAENGAAEVHAIVHLLVDTQDAMGANLINTMCEGVSPLVERISGGRVRLRILSNLADQRLARATCRIPFDALADFGFSGAEVAHGIAEASRFADADPYRACTHNKGVMNGVDAVALATGNDWRAIEAGAHAWAARNGRYEPLTRWWVEDGHLLGKAELPIQVGTVGGAVKANPLVPVLLRLMGNPGAQKLAAIMAAVGLAQNMAALRALGSVGIQKGHMALHARSVAVSAGAKGSAVEEVARALIAAGEIKLHRAQEILAKLVAQKPAAEVT
ncbi:MAG: hydroxymethylglutaryl-CoA reductase, degradative [Deltaproteobacteria bacterium]|nr:MAG: hydroxymethylglutaryl-CoA reductase, degradative [Deltaproteobacteria bacterium]